MKVVDALAPIKDAFNAHADKPRVLLLVSPTCFECVLGAQAVRKSIVDRFEQSGVVPIVVWEPMLDTDSEGAAVTRHNGTAATAPSRGAAMYSVEGVRRP